MAYEYINVDFHCEFSRVVYFKYDKYIEEKSDDKASGSFTFLYSEINTLSEQIDRQKEGEEYQSLIIEVMPSYAINSSYIELVFGDVLVEAIESTAFELMLASSDFEVPIYIENE